MSSPTPTPADRRRVEWIAEKVMGWRIEGAYYVTVERPPDDEGWSQSAYLKVEAYNPLTSISDAMGALEEWRGVGTYKATHRQWHIDSPGPDCADYRSEFVCFLCGESFEESAEGRADTKERAIVLALCAASGFQEEAFLDA